MVGCKARLIAQKFDAVLVVIVISAGDAIFPKFHIFFGISDSSQHWFFEQACAALGNPMGIKHTNGVH